MKVKCIKNYIDKEFKKLITTNDEPFEVSEKRAAVLLDAGVVEVVKVEENPEEPAEKPKAAPKKARKKKGE